MGKGTIRAKVPLAGGVNRQQEIHRRCFHPSGSVAKISDEEIHGSLAERFEGQAKQYARQTAYSDETGSMSYEDLNGAANRMAHAILAEKPEPGEPVLALLDESADRIISFLAILKAGACQVAINPKLPFERQQFIAGQSGARILLVQQQYREVGQKLAGLHGMVIEIEAITGHFPATNPGIAIKPDDNCWIVYTSGSTGQPKGVMQTHRNVLHDVRTYVEGFHISNQDRLSLLMSLTTTAGCFGTLMALANGATLCRIDVRRNGIEHMAHEVARQQLTIWGGVPSLFRQWMAARLPAYPQLRLVWFGGEAVHARDFELYRNNLPPSCLFVNRLGSTETHCTRIFFADHQTRITGATVPVGYPVRDQEIFLENPQGRQVTNSGEIVVRSAYLSPGYWKQPDLTAAAFRTVGDQPGLREYRTGDLGELDADGCLTYIGRKDFQVQIRGFRVEVTEVESLLDRLDSIREAAVVGQPLDEGGHELVAYVVPACLPGPGIPELRKELAAHVPDYMIPSRFVYLKELPRAANGKVVRAQLREAPELPVPCGLIHLAPRTQRENELMDIWQQVLRRPAGEVGKIGINENFFDLGGHSLSATQVISRIRKTLSVDVPLRVFFDHPTILELAREIDRLSSTR